MFDEHEGNVISANGVMGVFVSAASHNQIAGNRIGTTKNGDVALGNAREGVMLADGSQENIVGTDGDGLADGHEGNVISGNQIQGVLIAGTDTDRNVVAGNLVGTDARGTYAIPNAYSGVIIVGGAKQNRIGTNGDGIGDPQERNVISGNGYEGVYIADVGTDSNVLAGNFIGVNFVGNAALPNGNNGVLLNLGASSNVIGTNGDGIGDAFETNVISGNRVHGVLIIGEGTSSNCIAGNFIGTNESGTVGIPNGEWGVLTGEKANYNRVGVSSSSANPTAERNLVSGNGTGGIGIYKGEHNAISGNLVGTDISGQGNLGNGWSGIAITEGSYNTIGSNGDGVGDLEEVNVVAFNNAAGVNINGDAVGNRIQRNSIFENVGLGIDLGNDDVTPNDPGDVDVGPNDNVNFPEITSSAANEKTRVEGELHALTNASYQIDLYVSDVADPSGYGEGASWIGTKVVTTDATGQATFSVILDVALEPGAVITATATDEFGNTSEFSGTSVIDYEPPLIVEYARGDEDTAIPLSIEISELLSDTVIETVVINDLPEGAELSAGINNWDGSWTLTLEQLAGLTIKPPTHSDTEFELLVQAVPAAPDWLVEWSEADGGNGHYYGLVGDEGVLWTEARDAAADLTFRGSQGHLATIITAEESDFLEFQFSDRIGDPVASGGIFPPVPGIHAWIGLTDAAVEGDFRWITGEPLSFTDWAPPEPNNLGNEDYVLVWRRDFGSGPLWSWNDGGNWVGPADGFFVEFEDPFLSADPILETTVQVTVDAVADAPELNVRDTASGFEGSVIPLTITSSLVDTDGSETLSLKIENLPPGATLSNTAGDSWTPTGGTITLQPEQLPGLQILVPDDADVTLAVTATATEANPTSTDLTVSVAEASTTATILLTVRQRSPRGRCGRGSAVIRSGHHQFLRIVHRSRYSGYPYNPVGFWRW